MINKYHLISATYQLGRDELFQPT